MLKLAYSSSIAATLAIIFITALTIWAELSPPLKDSLTAITGHHWVTKSVLTMAVYAVGFIVFYYAFGANAPRVRRAVITLIVISWLATAGLVVFFFWHYVA